MAALQFSVSKNAIALVAATIKTCIQVVAPANHRVKVLGYAVEFDGVSATAIPVSVRLLRQTTAGTMSALTPVPLDKSLSETILSSAQHTATAEPTAGDVLDQQYVHPQSGYERIFPFGQEPIIQGGGRMGIDCNAPANVNVTVRIFCEE